eukprot:7923783-Karenia_brevis.AAC.1
MGGSPLPPGVSKGGLSSPVFWAPGFESSPAFWAPGFPAAVPGSDAVGNPDPATVPGTCMLQDVAVPFEEWRIAPVGLKNLKFFTWKEV